MAVVEGLFATELTNNGEKKANRKGKCEVQGMYTIIKYDMSKTEMGREKKKKNRWQVRVASDIVSDL